MAQIPGIEVPVYPDSNILMCRITDSYYKKTLPEDTSAAYAFVDRLRDQSVLALAIDSRQVRMVTHYDLPADAVVRTLEAASAERS